LRHGHFGSLALSWTNPGTTDWRWTRLVRKTGGYPTHWRDGFACYEGKLSAYTDIGLANGTTYYYGAYTCDHAGNYSAAVTTYGTPAAPAPTANFTAAPVSGSATLTVNFTDTSTDSPTSWAWDFTNDGTNDSTAQNPSYAYSSAGTYTVKLTATNAQGSDSEVKANYITVTAGGQQSQTWVASTGYSSTQGANQWYYKEWTGSAYQNMTWNAGNGWWNGTYTTCIVGNSWQHPENYLSARTWVSPQTGSTRITGTVTLQNSLSDGTVASIYQNSRSCGVREPLPMAPRNRTT